MIVPFSRLRAAHLRIGHRGERLAVASLRARYCRILARNYRCPAGEIDIVALDGNCLVFVEVKTRRESSAGRPAAGGNEGPRQRINPAARAYRRTSHRPPNPVRVDQIELRISRWDVVELRHWENHFSAPGFGGWGG